MKIKTSWEYSLETESRRLLHTAHQIAVYFYQTNGFLVLPNEVKSLPDHAVIFPDLAYPTIPRFFEKAKKVDIDTPISVEQQQIDTLAHLLRENGVPDAIDERSEILRDNWQHKGDVILNAIAEIIPDTDKLLRNIVIHPTHFGTRQSFNRLTPKRNELYIFIRFDATIATITESILSALTRQFVFNELSGTWSESEMVVDWLLMQSKLAKLVGSDYIPTVNSLRRNEQSKYKNLSDKYLTKLGFPHPTRLLTLEEDKILFVDKPLLNLSSIQKSVLSKLISNGSLSTDELADIMFSDDGNYSLYAMAKFMQRLRDKLESNGLTGSVIQTVRGFGYTMRT